MRIDHTGLLRAGWRGEPLAGEYESAVDVISDEVGPLYAAMAADKEPIPKHFLDPKDDLL
jgi:hypothetical protein